MENTKKAVLIIEDDEDQISWAKNQLGDKYELMFARSCFQFEKEERRFDFIITDVFLPGLIKKDMPDFPDSFFEENEQPSSKHLAGIIRSLHERYTKGELAGWSIASNFEHHRDTVPREEAESLFAQMQAYKLLSQKVCGKKVMNIGIFFDEDVYGNKVILDGKVVDVDMMSKDDILERLMRGKQGKILKPYERIMEHLEEK